MPEQNNAYICPRCKEKGLISNIMPLLEDVRYDGVSCNRCGAQWRVYYKFINPHIEVTAMPPLPEETPSEPTTEEGE